MRSDNFRWGFYVRGDRNKLMRNLAEDNALDGILLTYLATRTQVTRNISLGNEGTDLVDGSLDCGTNKWRKI